MLWLRTFHYKTVWVSHCPDTESSATYPGDG
uniref:Uncharacterized protein n=1 Tax=Arundo donax TaxID=35708 RepID=A0A0A8YQ80_ARUDO